MGRQNISKWEMAAHYQSIADTLEIIKTLPDYEIINGINGLINYCKNRSKELDPKYKPN